MESGWPIIPHIQLCKNLTSTGTRSSTFSCRISSDMSSNRRAHLKRHLSEIDRRKNMFGRCLQQLQMRWESIRRNLAIQIEHQLYNSLCFDLLCFAQGLHLTLSFSSWSSSSEAFFCSSIHFSRPSFALQGECKSTCQFLLLQSSFQG